MRRMIWIMQGGVALAAAAALVFTASTQASAAEHQYTVYNSSDEQPLTIVPSGFNGDLEADSYAAIDVPPHGHYTWTGTADTYHVTFKYPDKEQTETWGDNTQDWCWHVSRNNRAEDKHPHVELQSDYAAGCGFLN